MLTGNSEVNTHKSNLKILVAHDNELSRAVTSKTLQLLGHKYDSANTGKEVLEKSKRDDYDLIIMDVPAPSTIQLGLLHSVDFYRVAQKRLAPQGLISVSLCGTFSARNTTPRTVANQRRPSRPRQLEGW